MYIKIRWDAQPLTLLHGDVPLKICNNWLVAQASRSHVRKCSLVVDRVIPGSLSLRRHSSLEEVERSVPWELVGFGLATCLTTPTSRFANSLTEIRSGAGGVGWSGSLQWWASDHCRWDAPEATVVGIVHHEWTGHAGLHLRWHVWHSTHMHSHGHTCVLQVLLLLVVVELLLLLLLSKGKGLMPWLANVDTCRDSLH